MGGKAKNVRISRFDRTVQVLQVLFWRFDGKIEHPSNAAGVLRAECIKVWGPELYGDQASSVYSGILGIMEEQGLIERLVNSRRTLLISCVDQTENWPNDLAMRVNGGEVTLDSHEQATANRLEREAAEAERERQKLIEEAVAEANARGQAVLDSIESTETWQATVGEKQRQEDEAVDEILLSTLGTQTVLPDQVSSYVRIGPEGIGTFPTEHDVARAMLERCFEIMQMPEALKDRLGEQTTVAQRLQRQNDGLQRQLREMSEHNKSLQERLKIALRKCDELQKNVNTLAAERIVLDPAQRKEYEKLMREFPTGKGGI